MLQGEFVLVAMESYSPVNKDALQFLNKLCRRLVETTGDVLASSFYSNGFTLWCNVLIQSCSIVMTGQGRFTTKQIS